MIVSYNWLQEYFKDKLPPANELADILNTRAYQVEGVKEVDGDYSIDVDVLPNRAHDSLCHRGIAKEISVITGLSFFDKKENLVLGEGREVEVEISNTDVCKRYYSLTIDNVEVKDSQNLIKHKMEVLEQRSINNVVDFTNIVMYEIGRPLHVFDKDKIKGKITIRNAKDGEQITTLDNKEVTLDTTIVVVADDEGPLAIAGIKGGKKAEVTKETKSIVLEAANWDSAYIRKASSKVNIKTDSSKRFENEISPRIAEEGIKMVACLILKDAGGYIGALVDVGEKDDEIHKVSVSLEEINSLLGTNLNGDIVEAVLKKLNFAYENDGEKFIVTAPTNRLDIRIKEDVIEEIGRIYGYENIVEKPIEDNKNDNVIDGHYAILILIKNLLCNLGFSEIVTSSFREEGDIATLKPVAQDKKYLRTNIKDAIESALETNVRNADLLGLDFVKVFEIGKTFERGEEELHLCFGVLGNKIKKPKASEFINTVIDELNNALDLKIKEVSENEHILEVVIPDRVLNSETVKNSPLLANSTEIESYKTFSQYPFVLRDIAVWVPDNIPTDGLLNLIKEHTGELLVNTKLFDEYKKDGKVSYAFRLVFQSFEKTLTDDEVNVVMEKVNKALESKGWEVR
ncbi:phenylalanine--tRNA ligase subunit beta [Candidatus Nomurabacteria bacterium]|nr:phenylalanine--tRNA ligase subunit beta [Candidatus Nomurabacteria bacterium]